MKYFYCNNVETSTKFIYSTKSYPEEHKQNIQLPNLIHYGSSNDDSAKEFKKKYIVLF